MLLPLLLLVAGTKFSYKYEQIIFELLLGFNIIVIASTIILLDSSINPMVQFLNWHNFACVHYDSTIALNSSNHY